MQKRSEGPDRAERVRDCAGVRDELPLRASGALPEGREEEIRWHLTDCTACRAEAALVDRIAAARPEPPASILAGVLRATEERSGKTGRSQRLAWALSAAAVAVLALGVGVFWSADGTPDSLWSIALENPTAAWQGDDWVVAGEPVLEALSDEELRAILEELEE